MSTVPFEQADDASGDKRPVNFPVEDGQLLTQR
jgi:hypothetical protein